VKLSLGVSTIMLKKKIQKIFQGKFVEDPIRKYLKNNSKKKSIIDAAIAWYEYWFPIEKAQGEFFANLIINNIPENVSLDIKQNNLSMIDFGCSCGHLVNLLKNKYNNSDVCGIDIEEIRIIKGKKYYPDCKFILGDIKKVNKDFDCVFTSNVLEHFEDPFFILKDLIIPYAKRYIFILVPYNEEKLIDGHLYSFKNTFPNEFMDFNKIHETIIECNNQYWPGSQVFVIYKKND